MKKTIKEKADSAIKEVVKPVGKKFKVVVELNGQVYKLETDNIAQDLLGLKLSLFKSKALVTVTCGKKTYSKTFLSGLARRLFNNSVHAQLFEKNVKAILG